MHIQSLSTRFTLVAVLLAVSACTTAKVVSSSGGGPTIQQAQQEPVAGPKKRIAVTAFEFKAARGSREVGRGMSDMLSDALFNTNRFIVLEREHIKEVIQEQDFGASGRVKRETAAPIGELEGAQLIIRGSVTEFEPRCKGGAALIIAAQQACVTVNLRIVDAKTGRVVNATTVEGRSGSVGGGLVFATGSLPVGLGGWAKTPMESAIRNCIETAVQHIANTKL
ncbi:MAG TPA: CsgG/HfaB family protein [Acidiferrobacterales bacterium]|nr:CsgG/HfaB family protein [Acidiferrobacterales bacterium]